MWLPYYVKLPAEGVPSSLLIFCFQMQLVESITNVQEKQKGDDMNQTEETANTKMQQTKEIANTMMH